MKLSRVFSASILCFFSILVLWMMMSDTAFAGDTQGANDLKNLGFFHYIVLFDTLIVMWCLHKIYHSMFEVYYFSLQAFFQELVLTGIFAGMITFLVPGWLKMKMGGPMSYLYFGGIFVVSLALIARSGKK